MSRFIPPPYLKNRHVQTVANSMKTRRLLIYRRARGMLAASGEQILECGKGVRLLGFYSPQKKNPSDLCILIHGWEGDSSSSYLLSAAGCLFNLGFSVFRLNLRDHGPSHHLNRGLFHGCRLEETIGAVKRIQENFTYKRLFLAGFSLGGNFALRIGAHAEEAGLELERIAAVCPVLHPEHSVAALENGFFLYHWYFTRKWLSSLRIKQAFFPDFVRLDGISPSWGVRGLTDFFVENYTEFPDSDAYLSAYAITGSRLESLSVPSTIIASLDDPVIPSEDLELLPDSERLTVEKQSYGGHCGFLKDISLASWADKRIGELFTS